jgi:hypothetical protein
MPCVVPDETKAVGSVSLDGDEVDRDDGKRDPEHLPGGERLVEHHHPGGGRGD